MELKDGEGTVDRFGHGRKEDVSGCVHGELEHGALFRVVCGFGWLREGRRDRLLESGKPTALPLFQGVLPNSLTTGG